MTLGAPVCSASWLPAPLGMPQRSPQAEPDPDQTSLSNYHSCSPISWSVFLDGSQFLTIFTLLHFLPLDIIVFCRAGLCPHFLSPHSLSTEQDVVTGCCFAKGNSPRCTVCVTLRPCLERPSKASWSVTTFSQEDK